MEQLWKDVLAEIEVEVSQPIYLGFFRITSLVEKNGSVATINVATPIARRYIEERYYSLIKKILDKKTGENMSLLFTSDAAPKTVTKKTETPLFIQETVKKRPARIRPDYTFESLAVSESNQLAYTAALTVASNIGKRYNPLYLYGTVGVGKTHLMNAIANQAYTENENYKIEYMTCEEFTNEVVEAIKEKSTAVLRKRFRNVDILLIDDIQFLTGKDRVQEELFHTFNTLSDRGSQVVFSSDRPPSEIRKLEARLASRFEGGLIVDVEPPDFELRCAILLIKSDKYGISLTPDLAGKIAERVEDARALEGTLLKLSSLRSDGKIDVDDISRALGKTKQIGQILRPDDIIEGICSFYNIKTTQLKGAKRDAFLVTPRHICMFLLKETGLTYVEIGNLLGGRDHTTVMHAVEKMEKLSSTSDKYREEIMFIKRKLKEDFAQAN